MPTLAFAVVLLHLLSCVDALILTAPSARPTARRVDAQKGRVSAPKLGLFPDGESLLSKSALGAEDSTAAGLFPGDEEKSRLEKDRSITEYTDRSKTAQRMKKNVYEEMREGVPVNRAAKRAAAKKKAKLKKKSR